MHRLSSQLCLSLLALGSASSAAAQTPLIAQSLVISRALDPAAKEPAETARVLLESQIDGSPGLRRVKLAQAAQRGPEAEAEAEAKQRAKAALDDGKVAYDALRLDEASLRLKQAVKLYRESMGALQDFSELEEALAFLGATEVLRGLEDSGIDAFLQLLALNAGYLLNAPPSAVARAFETALQRFEQAPKASLEVYSTPAYAAVFLNARFVGVTPLRLKNLPEGEALLQVEKAGYAPSTRRIQLKAKRRLTEQSRLKSLPQGAVFRDLADRAARSLKSNTPSEALSQLETTYKADQSVVLAVTVSGQDVTFLGAVYRKGRKLTEIPQVLSLGHPSYPSGLRAYLESLVKALESAPEGLASAEPQSLTGGLPGDANPNAAGQPSLLDGQAAPSAMHETGQEAPPQASGRAPAPKSRTQAIIGGSLVGVGGAALINGAIFGILTASHHADYLKTPQNSPDLRDLRQRGKQKALIADISYAAGAALILTGAALLFFDGDDDALSGEDILQTGIAPSPDGFRVAIGGRF